MEFDHPVRVEADGSVTERVPGVYAPESIIEVDKDEQISDATEATWLDSLRRQGWEPIDGYSSQYRYSGPIMHASESIGGQLERDILAEPGVYVVVSVECLPPATCTECGEEAWVDQESGTSHHYSESSIENIDHDADADHVALVDEDAETEPAGWAVLRRITAGE
jgi:hypothetical protein